MPAKAGRWEPEMKVGLIGCGGMGTTHNLSLKALSALMDLEVVAIADCREEFLSKAALQWPKARKYQWGKELIEEEQLEIVHICLPSYLHTEHAALAMEKGMNVFIEKPVCLTEEESNILLNLKKKMSVQVMVGQVVRSYPEYRYLKDCYQREIFGKLKSIVMQRVGGDAIWGYEDWFHQEKKSGTVVLDLHIHDLDFLRFMLGEPDSIEVKATAFESGLINQIVTNYQFGNVFATAEGTWDVSPAFPFSSNFRACFENATVTFSTEKPISLVVYHKDGRIENPFIEKEYDVTDHSAGINISNIGPYYSEIKYFAECVANQKENEMAPLEEGIKSVLLGIRELEAAKKWLKQKK